MMEPLLKNPWEVRFYVCKVRMRVNNAFALPWSDCSRQCPAGEADRNYRQGGEGYEELEGLERGEVCQSFHSTLGQMMINLEDWVGSSVRLHILN